MESESKPNEVTAAETPVQFLPPSLMRVRAFLFEHGMAIIPWATAGEVLEDFHELLRSHKADDAFWQSLHGLLLALNIDLRRLAPNQSHDAVLDDTTKQALLAEIRVRIDDAQTPSNGFVSLSQRLTQACLPVLLLLAGAATVSCGARTDEASTNGDTGGTSATAAQTGGAGGFSSFIPATGGANATPPVVCNNTAPPLSMSDVQSIAEQCIASSSTRDSVLACLSTLNDSWRAGIEYLLNCRTCADAERILLNLTQSCSGLGDTYSSCVLDPRNCITTVYLGVRMF
jgi:hypothetical protein